MTRLFLCLCLLLPSLSTAAPLVYDFRQPQYDPLGSQGVTYNGPDVPRISVQATGPNTRLYWDTQDGLGITGPSYADDEVEGTAEILRVIWDAPVRIIGIGLSDLFYESEWYPGAPPCYVPGWPTCYREHGEYSADQGATWLGVDAPLSNLRVVTNGEVTFPTFLWTSELWFRAPGAMTVPGFPYTQLHDFALLTLTIKDPGPPAIPAVPEPGTLTLLGLGLLGVTRKEVRRRCSK